jgi:acetoin utilization deacetylase AcuC-like enzyme
MAHSPQNDTRPHTGIFYHPSFSRRSYLTQGSRLQDFPHVLKSILENPRYRFYESPPIDEDLILQVHTPELLRGVERDGLCSTAWHSAGGVVLAAEEIVRDRITNGFAFIGAGGHHSGRDFFGGYCCFNDVAIAMHVLREKYGVKRFAILDTDAHHGDGTRDLTKNDSNVLHVCICSTHYESADGTKIDVPAPGRPWFHTQSGESDDVDGLYAQTAIQAFDSRVRRFEPEIIFWYFGFDTHRGDYGDIGLSLGAYTKIAKALKALALEVCGGRLEVVLGGGSRSDIARDVIPPIISILGSEQELDDVRPTYA